jgi:murein DD-endopeptidase MepM/ murein hydrolase activator NlpD
MKQYTIQFIPPEGKIRELTITQRALIISITIGVIIIGAFIYFSVNIGRVYGKNIQYNLMKRKVAQLERKQKEIEYLSKEIRKFYVISTKLSNALGLDISPTESYNEENKSLAGRENEDLNEKTMEEEAKRLRDFIPDIMPCFGGWISKEFSGEHKAIDISLKEGSSIFATIEGEVVFSGERQYLGKTIEISNDEGFLVLYGHNNKNLVRKGAKVKKGDIIALSGNTGRSDAPHLHYGIQMHGKWVNPINYLPIRR